MAFIEITTDEIAKIVSGLNKKQNISNFKGMPNGLSFVFEKRILITNTQIPLKIEFREYVDNQIKFEVLTNSDNPMIIIAFETIKNNVSVFIPQTLLTKGITVENNYIIVNPSIIAKQKGFEINITEVSLIDVKMVLQFEIMEKASDK